MTRRLAAVLVAATVGGLFVAPMATAAPHYTGSGYWIYLCDDARAEGYPAPYNLAWDVPVGAGAPYMRTVEDCAPGRPLETSHGLNPSWMPNATISMSDITLKPYGASGLAFGRASMQVHSWNTAIGRSTTDPTFRTMALNTGVSAAIPQTPTPTFTANKARPWSQWAGAIVQCYTGDYVSTPPRADGVRYITDSRIWGSQASTLAYLDTNNDYGGPIGAGPDNELMTGDVSQPYSNLDGRCELDKRLVFDFEGNRFAQIHMYASCQDPFPLLWDHQYCPGLSGANAETRPNVLKNLSNDGGWGTRMSGASLYVSDEWNPSVSFINDGSPNNLAKGGGAVSQDSPFANPALDPEYVRVRATDAAGIRRVRAWVDGRLIGDVDLNSRCDHRYRYPCPGADQVANPGLIGGRESPPLPPGVNTGDLRFDTDVDPLALGVAHTVEVEVVDGSGRVSRISDTFRVLTPNEYYSQCDVGAGVNPGPFGPPVVNPRGVADDAEATGCQDASSVPTGNNTPVEDRPTSTGSPVVPPPSKGVGIFTYDLAANERPAQRPADPNSCVTRSGVIGSGATGGMLGDVERNQIISVTVNLEGLIDKSKELGEMDLRTSFDLPARNNLEYRRALGC